MSPVISVRSFEVTIDYLQRLRPSKDLERHRHAIAPTGS